jgi:hypothetical protein
LIRTRLGDWWEDRRDDLGAWWAEHGRDIKITSALLALIVLCAVLSYEFTMCSTPAVPMPPTATSTPFESTIVPHPPTRTLTSWPTKTATNTVSATSTPSLTRTAARPTTTPSYTASATSSLTLTRTATPTLTPTLPTIPSGRNLTPIPGTVTPLIPIAGGQADPSKCESGYQPQLGIIGKDIVIYLNCLDDEQLEDSD